MERESNREGEVIFKSSMAVVDGGKEMNTKPLKNLRHSRRRRVVPEEEGPFSFSPKLIEPSSSQFCSSDLAHLTVWRKSLLFNGHGYTVYDSKGNMVFRVDNYASNWRQETFLMDSRGNVLLTIRRRSKKLFVWERWEAFRGDVLGLQGQHRKPLFTATKAMGNPSCNILVSGEGDDKALDYRMNWSRQQGWSRIYRSTSSNLPVAQVNRKCGNMREVLLGKDVLNLCVQPGVDQAIVMALVIINHAME